MLYNTALHVRAKLPVAQTRLLLMISLQRVHSYEYKTFENKMKLKFHHMVKKRKILPVCALTK